MLFAAKPRTWPQQEVNAYNQFREPSACRKQVRTNGARTLHTSQVSEPVQREHGLCANVRRWLRRIHRKLSSMIGDGDSN